ncbi:hypothetical protein [Bradyrhizobium sp. LMTR 3]|uniref:hypothetical protein n=1 Tax=Bradyrhizobium sp. LMTR 3 TaxID=189873 RepID=UPI000810D54A|nr:hypothetical protein [Bradyrhizobium sp. LMTR 3]OCK55551.1 hypothetical protein LMTR3_12200 [Bradyrhizobium sp. LMTR 3]
MVNAMSKYNDEERKRIIAETYATLQRGAADHEEPSPVPDLPPEDVLAEALARPLEDRVERWRREADEQTARFARFARERRRQERRPVPINWDVKIAEAIAEERGFLLEVLAETVAELADRQTRATEDALRPMQIELSELKIANAELRVANAELRVQQSADHGSTIDLPALPLRSRAN